MENAVTETNGGKARGGVSRLTMYLAGWRCKGDSNNSNSSIMGKKKNKSVSLEMLTKKNSRCIVG